MRIFVKTSWLGTGSPSNTETSMGELKYLILNDNASQHELKGPLHAEKVEPN